MTTWGSADGEVACDDPALAGTGVFPGPEELTALSATGLGNFDSAATPVNDTVAAGCDAALFGAAAYVNKLGAAATGADNSIIFEKTHRAEPTPTMEQVAATEFERAHVLTTTHRFAGGPFHANMPSTGSDEGFERALLYSNCGVGTDPPAVAGEWRSVEITEAKAYYVAGVAIDAASNPAPSITRKVCVRLDSTPGTVKCFVDKPDVGTNAMVSIGIYNPDGTLTPIMTTSTAGLTGDAGALQFTAAADFNAANLCRLFEGGGA